MMQHIACKAVLTLMANILLHPALKCKEVIFYRVGAACRLQGRGAIMLRDPPPAAETNRCTTAEKFAKYANGGSLSMCQIESVAFGINQCHHSDGSQQCLPQYSLDIPNKQPYKSYLSFVKNSMWILLSFHFHFHYIHTLFEYSLKMK